MGQQQILLLILVTIIVGLSSVVALHTVHHVSDEAMMDAIHQDILHAQSMAMNYFRQPVTLGGGGGSYTEITLQHLSLPARNENAVYTLEQVSDSSFQIIARSSRGLNVSATINGKRLLWDN